MKIVYVSWRDMIGSIPITTTDDGKSVCPVCGDIGDADGHAWGGMEANGQWVGGPSFDICPECGTQYGLSDNPPPGVKIEDVWRRLRRDYLNGPRGGEGAKSRIAKNLGAAALE